jgi:hypothetical protein
MAMDVPRRLIEHLQLLPAQTLPQIDLLLHSNGGDVVVPWRLVTLLRERCERLAVLIPHAAHSAATLTALGADEIVMLPLATLGPIDPTTANPFNPRDPAAPSEVVGINVEDVAAYVALVKQDIGITHEDEVVHALIALTNAVHPLALGNVKRASQQSRMLARKLLSLHMNAEEDAHVIDSIVERLSSDLYSHGHPINRQEAKTDLDLKVVIAPPAVENVIWTLYTDFETDLQLTVPFSAEAELLASGRTVESGHWTTLEIPEPQRLVYLESARRSDVLQERIRLTGTLSPDGVFQIVTTTQSQAWICE